MVWEEMSFEEFQDGLHGGHLGYWDGKILAILNLCVTVMPPHQGLAQSNLQFERRCRLKNFKMAAVAASWISEWNDFSNSDSLCHCDASHEVSAQSDLGFGRRCRLKNFKMAAMVAILDIRTEQF